MPQIKRFENKAQLLRQIHDETGVEMDELWNKYERQVNPKTK